MEDSSSASGREESPIPTNTFAAAEEQVKSRAMSSSDDGPLPQIKAVVNDTGGFIPTDNPQVLCTPLPLHCRVNSPIHIPFIVVTTLPVPDGTLVRLSANNKFNPVADLKNAEALMTNQMAKFPDIRFVGRSGRGRRLNVHIEIQCDPQIVAVYENAIKVTADGPREPRRNNSRFAPYNHSDSWQQQRQSLSGPEEGKEWCHPGINTLISVEGEQDTQHMVTQQSPHSVDSGTEEDVPMSTDPSGMGLSNMYSTVKTYSPMQLESAKHVSQSPLVNSPGKEASIMLHRGINGSTNAHHQTLTVEALSEGSNSPLSPSVQKSPLSLMHRRVFYLPSSPTVVSPPCSATLPSQVSTSQPATAGESQKPQGGAPNVTVAAQLFSVPQSGPGALLQPVLFQPSLNSSPATSQAILMPISPHNAQKGQQLLQFPFVHNASQPVVTSPTATTSATHAESESVLDGAQNVKYLKALDHKTILKLLDNMGLERYHQMFIKEHVDGELLSSMSELDLEELGIQSSLHKKRFVKLIEGKHSARDYLEKGNPYHASPHDSC